MVLERYMITFKSMWHPKFYRAQVNIWLELVTPNHPTKTLAQVSIQAHIKRIQHETVK